MPTCLPSAPQETKKMNKTEEALIRLFEQHRLIFWFDDKGELQEDFDTLSLQGIEKIHVQGDEFAVRYRVQKQAPEQKFLLYFSHPRPDYESHWLLDLELANNTFHTDQKAMYLQDLGLPYEYSDLVAQHLEFFKAKERIRKLKKLLQGNETAEEVVLKMLTVIFNTEQPDLIAFILSYAKAFIEENDKPEKALKKFKLYDVFWKAVSERFKYQKEEKTIYDFLIELFNSNSTLIDKTTLSDESKIILSQWQDKMSLQESFKLVSEKIGEALHIENKLQNATLEEVVNDKLFKQTDQKVIHELISRISAEEISTENLQQYIKVRESLFWFENYKSFYTCLTHASKLITLVKKYENIRFESFQEGVKRYTEELYKVDSAYRNFIVSYRKTNQNGNLSLLAEKIEKVYGNSWLLPFNDQWQETIGKLDKWDLTHINAQKGFFTNHLKPIVDKKQRVFVVISDALRYECGVSLFHAIQQENRFGVDLSHLVTTLPSYTQLGMASLLPHKSLTVTPSSDTIEADGILSQGIAGRTKILQKHVGERATAITAEDLIKKSSPEGREFVKNHDLIYIYHNRIDKTGDDKVSEEKVFEAVEEEIRYLIEVLKKISSLNGNLVFVTADHGFIYQNQPLDESDFADKTIEGNIWKENRRFVLGENLEANASMKKFQASALGLSGNTDILIPNSINRLRVKGAGSQFVHGGATLQEIVVPMLKVVKKRKDTVSQVEIDIIQSTNKITTNILAVSFIQSEAISDQVLPVNIRAFIASKEGETLSDIKTHYFDSKEESYEQREVKHKFQLSSEASNKFKNKEVNLILERQIPETNNWDSYKSFSYTINISFANDFD